VTRIAIGTWAFLFNQERPTTDFHELLHNLSHLGYEGVELGAAAPHPTAGSHDTPEKRDRLKRMVLDHGLEFSALAPDLSSHKLVSVPDCAPYLEAFAAAVAFAADLGIKTIRVDTVEPIAVMKQQRLDPVIVLDRAAAAFDRCAKLAAARGINVAWEFEPGLPLNKPSEILALVQRVRDDLGNPNFGALFDTGHAHLCAAVGANQPGDKETLPGGALELLQKLTDKITHLHLIDSDGTMSEYNTSTRIPLGAGTLDFDKLIPALLACGAADDWWCVDLCYWPDAWEAAAECRRFLHRLRRKHGDSIP
jgi:sugar phosphate isomerase/epimerase